MKYDHIRNSLISWFILWLLLAYFINKQEKYDYTAVRDNPPAWWLDNFSMLKVVFSISSDMTRLVQPIWHVDVPWLHCNCLHFGHGLLIFLILTVFWLSETSQICSFGAFSSECTTAHPLSQTRLPYFPTRHQSSPFFDIYIYDGTLIFI